MSIKLLTEHHLEFLNLKGGCTGSSESTLVKMPHCWKSQVAAHFWLPLAGKSLITDELTTDERSCIYFFSSSRPKCHAMFTDSTINSLSQICINCYQLFLLSAHMLSTYNLRLYVSVHLDRSVMPCSQIVPSTPTVRSVSTVISCFYCQHTSSLPITSDFMFQFIKTEVSCHVHR